MTPNNNTVALLISQLHASAAKIQTVDPEGPTYKAICKCLDAASNDALRAVHEANIKFFSALALNRLIRRGAWSPSTARARVGGSFGS